jgi:Methyltransferase domain
LGENEADRVKYGVTRARYSSDMSGAEFALIAPLLPPPKRRALGAISDRTRRVVEIGPGSGRYLEKILELCTPESYQIYETAGDWANYVASTYGVTRCPTDGRKLGATEADSVDLIQAYKVLSATTFLTTARYWSEMARVTRVGGHAVFDIVTEDCLDLETVERWAMSDLETGTYPASMPRRVALDFFAGNGFQLAGSFVGPMGVGATETFVFKRVTRDRTPAG